MPHLTSRAAVATLMGVSAVVALPETARADVPVWQVTRTYATPEPDSFSAIVSPARDDAWVFGGTLDPNPRPAARHWDGERWRPVALPDLPGQRIIGASASSTTNVWAYTSLSTTDMSSSVLRWDGSGWEVVRKVSTPVSVVAAGSREAWVFGGKWGDETRPLWHFDGTAWNPVDFGNTDITAAAALSPTEIWGSGQGSKMFEARVARYDGERWRVVDTGGALPPWDWEVHPELGPPAARSSREVWFPVNQIHWDGVPQPSLLLRWDGATWKRITVPGEGRFQRVLPDGRGGVWTVQRTGGSSVIRHMSAAGEWTLASIEGAGDRPVTVNDLARRPGTRTFLGAGSVGDDAALLRHRG